MFYILFLIFPYEKVVAGVSADDNEVVYQSHEVHSLEKVLFRIGNWQKIQFNRF